MRRPDRRRNRRVPAPDERALIAPPFIALALQKAHIGCNDRNVPKERALDCNEGGDVASCFPAARAASAPSSRRADAGLAGARTGRKRDRHVPCTRLPAARLAAPRPFPLASCAPPAFFTARRSSQHATAPDIKLARATRSIGVRPAGPRPLLRAPRCPPPLLPSHESPREPVTDLTDGSTRKVPGLLPS